MDLTPDQIEKLKRLITGGVADAQQLQAPQYPWLQPESQPPAQSIQVDSPSTTAPPTPQPAKDRIGPPPIEGPDPAAMQMGNPSGSPSRAALMQQPKKDFPGPAFEPMEEGEAPKPQEFIPPDDTAQRYQKALEVSRRMKAIAGGMSDLNDAAQMAMYSGSHIRAGVKPLRFGNAYDQAQASNAEEAAQSIPAIADMDPMSPRSLHLAEVGKSMGFGDKLKGMSAGQMIKIFPFLAKAVDEKSNDAYRQQQLSISQNRFDETKADHQRKELASAAENYQKVINVRNNALQSARQARSAVNSGTQTGLAAVATLLQKAAGDTGNISQSEQAQYQHRVQVLDRIHDWFTQTTTGGMTPARKKDILGLLDQFEKGNEEFVNDMADSYARRYSFILDKDPEELKTKLFRTDTGRPMGTAAPSPQGNTVHYNDAGVDYDIPIEKEGAFLQAHPKAVRAGHGG